MPERPYVLELHNMTPGSLLQHSRLYVQLWAYVYKLRYLNSMVSVSHTIRAI